MVTIRKRRDLNGIRYELADFQDYVSQLKDLGIEPPLANYRVFIASEDQPALFDSVADYEQQIARFFKLSPATNVTYQIQDET